MLRFAWPLLLSVALAPAQCSGKPDPDMRREDTAGDGLWSLAEDFKAKGNDEAYRATLRFLVTRYPGHRRVPKARDELQGSENAGAANPANSSSKP